MVRFMLVGEDGGLLTDNAEIRVTYRKDDSRFRIQWDIAGGLEPIEQEEGRRKMATHGRRHQASVSRANLQPETDFPTRKNTVCVA